VKQAKATAINLDNKEDILGSRMPIMAMS